MANNPNVNKVVYGNTTVMDISDTTAEPQNVLSGEVFYDRSGARQIGTAIGGVPEEELRDTVGWTGKNILPLYLSDLKTRNTAGTWTDNAYARRGITYTVTTDVNGVVTKIVADGTASADSPFVLDSNIDYLSVGQKYIISGCPAEGGDSKYYLRLGQKSNASDDWGSTPIVRDTGSGVETTIPSNSYGFVIVANVISGQTVSNIEFYPMLRKATITDPTFEPYHATVEECKFNRSEQRVLGAKNFLDNQSTDETQKGVTFTHNEDGSITINGTSTNTIYKPLNNALNLENGAYLISDNFPDHNNAFVYVHGIKSGGSYDYSIGSTYGNGNNAKFNTNNALYVGGYACGIQINSGVTFNNFTVYPMIRLASDPDNTYAPYAMTNRELTDKAYTTDDTAETDIQDNDYFPFYDTSATAKRKSLWSNIIAKIKAALATVATSGSYYDLVDEPQNESATSGQGAYTVSLCTRMEKYQWNQAFNNTVKRHTGSALAGATSVYIPIDFATDHIVSIGADNGHDQILKYKTIGIYGGGGLPVQVGLTFSALAYDTDFEVLTI